MPTPPRTTLAVAGRQPTASRTVQTLARPLARSADHIEPSTLHLSRLYGKQFTVWSSENKRPYQTPWQYVRKQTRLTVSEFVVSASDIFRTGGGDVVCVAE